MLAGPIFSREALTSPRQLRHYLIRSGYVTALFLLMDTVGRSTFGYQTVRNVGDIARFGSLTFQFFSIVQLSLVLFFALLFAASSVAQEKDRGTLVLLLMTDLRDREVVLGKLFASLLMVAVLLAASVPVFVFLYLLGGIALDQIMWSLAICASAALAAGSWGAMVAFWREKTFQTLATSVLGAVLFIGVVEAVIGFFGDQSPVAAWAMYLNPYRALLGVMSPLSHHTGLTVVRVSAHEPVLAMVLLAFLLNATAIWRLRVWNPSRSVAPRVEDHDKTAPAQRKDKTREVWSNPIIWREIRTRAYGRRMILIKMAYVVLALFAVFYLYENAGRDDLVLGMIAPAGFAFVGLSLMSLLLINAQAVTALTSERDLKTLELLLVTDVTAKEFIYGKLGGIVYNTKELILIPVALIAYFVFDGSVSGENFVYLLIGFLVLVAFASMLGLHSGLSFDNSRSAIANSLGTMFFLFIGIFIFMMLLVEARSSFLMQLASFQIFIPVGSAALWVSLTHKNPSNALLLSAAMLPFLTFYSIIEFLLGGTLGVCFSVLVAYGFTTIAMLVPAVSDFDVALGRTTLDRG